MCLIIAPGKDGKKALLPRDVFDYAYQRNNDGFGGMYVEEGRVKHFKLLDTRADDEYDYMQEILDRHPEAIFHMRLKTHGKVMPSLCHPFRILHKNRHGKDLFFMHNGVLGEYGKDLNYGQSDTTSFKDKILVPLLTRNPDALDDPAVMSALNKMTSGSRLIFLDSDGKVYRTSEYSWNERYGLTLSNTYMLPPETFYSQQPKYAGPKVVSSPSSSSSAYPLMRRVKEGNVSHVKWCREIKPGFLRAQSGEMFRDSETLTLDWSKHYVSPENEFDAMLSEESTDKPVRFEEPSDADLKEIELAIEEDELNDDLPWKEEESITSDSKRFDERLRYARLVHNTHSGSVASRVNLLGDVLGMGNEELLSFVRDDPETATTVLSEIFEICLEQNDLLVMDGEEDNEDVGFSYEALLEVGDSKNHMSSMQAITTMRRTQYEYALAMKTAADKVKCELDDCSCANCEEAEEERTSAYA